MNKSRLKRDKFLIGYDNKMVMGVNERGWCSLWVETMTKKEAEQELKEFEKGAKLYRLVPYKPRRVK